MTIFDLELTGWLHPVGDKPWAVAPDPPMGLAVKTLNDIPPGLEDGTPVFVEEIGWGPGWVIIYDGIPHPVQVPDVPSHTSWINTYGVVPGVPAHVDETGGIATGTNEGSVPTEDLVGACAHSISPHVTVRVMRDGGSHESFGYDVAAFVDVGSIP